MRIIFSALLTLVLFFAVNAHANPTGVADDMDKYVPDKSLLAKIDQVRQTVGERTSELVFTAMGFLGVPYRRGGSTVESGFDCSGFVRAIYQETVGQILPRNAAQQAAATEKIDRTDLKPGDLVFYNTMRRAFSHVGIYIGEGKFIHAPKPGGEVRVEDMNLSYWKRRFDGARRVQPDAQEARSIQASPVIDSALR